MHFSKFTALLMALATAALAAPAVPLDANFEKLEQRDVEAVQAVDTADAAPELQARDVADAVPLDANFENLEQRDVEAVQAIDTADTVDAHVLAEDREEVRDPKVERRSWASNDDDDNRVRGNGYLYNSMPTIQESSSEGYSGLSRSYGGHYTSGNLQRQKSNDYSSSYSTYGSRNSPTRYESVHDSWRAKNERKQSYGINGLRRVGNA